MTAETSLSLDSIESGYTVFETDQVLTAEQLNQVADYVDDQQRLTRVALLGVGIACGLWPSLQGDAVRVSQGVGTTTDGDLGFLPQAALYPSYKPYDASNPKYGPFATGAGAIAAYELLTADGAKDDKLAKPVSGFDAAESPRTLAGMAVVLYVESFLHDPDMCTATDCDNRGQEWVHTTRLLLVDAAAAAGLAGALATPDAAARALQPIAIARPVPSGALATEADIAAVYGPACDAINNALLAALGALWAPCQWFLRDIAPADPGPRWRKTLADRRAAAPVRGMQYYYDFLKDVAETYNAFRDALFGDTAVCCPALDAFPKHLVLGSVDPARRTAVGRTGFYPSPMVDERFERRAHARFLLRKIDTLIATFALPGPGDIRVTPSVSERRPLEERAIPFYYAAVDTLPVQRTWSYALSRRGMENASYSYNAGRWAPAGTAAAAPLQYQAGARDFFRVEGHVGRPLDQVRAALDAAVTGANLPFDVVYLALAQPVRWWGPPWWHWHLYHLQYLARSDLDAHLDEITRFAPVFMDRVRTAAGAGVVADLDNRYGDEEDLHPGAAVQPVVGTAQAKVDVMLGHAANARAKIMAAEYDRNSNWQDNLSGLAGTAVELHRDLSPILKKEFRNPLEPIIAGRHARMLGWIDGLIKHFEDDETRRSQVPGFLADHPGLEHGAGVPRGGTFVVVYDASNTVVADFMLPYHCCTRRVAPPPLPPLPLPPRPDVFYGGAFRVVAFQDKFRFAHLRTDVDGRFTDFGKNLDVRFTTFGSNVDQRFSTLGGNVDSRFASFGQDFDRRLAELGNDINTRFLNLGKDISDRFSTVAVKTETPLAAVQVAAVTVAPSTRETLTVSSGTVAKTFTGETFTRETSTAETFAGAPTFRAGSAGATFAASQAKRAPARTAARAKTPAKVKTAAKGKTAKAKTARRSRK